MVATANPIPPLEFQFWCLPLKSINPHLLEGFLQGISMLADGEGLGWANITLQNHSNSKGNRILAFWSVANVRPTFQLSITWPLTRLSPMCVSRSQSWISNAKKHLKACVSCVLRGTHLHFPASQTISNHTSLGFPRRTHQALHGKRARSDHFFFDS